MTSQKIKSKSFICRCNKITEEIIIKSILNGANNLSLIKALTKASTSCGGCESEIEKIILRFE